MDSMTEKELLAQWGEAACQIGVTKLMEGPSLELRYAKTFSKTLS